MTQIHVTQGLSHELALARILRSNGFHIIHVHNGVITQHAKLEAAESWVDDAIAKWARRKRKAGKEEENQDE